MGTAGRRRARIGAIVCVLAAGAVVALATGGWARADGSPGPPVAPSSAGPGPDQPTVSRIAPSTTAANVPVGPPDMNRLLAIADEVSSDGRYVRIGDVEISASPVVTRRS